MRLDKYLANSGIGTRTEVKKIIKSKKIKVNNKIITDPSFCLDEDFAEVSFLDTKISYRPFRYIMLNKPKNVVSASYDKTYTTVIDLVKKDFSTYKLFPIGRLDIDTVGLLILTNDGELTHNLLSPKKHIKKTYYVEYEKEMSISDINKLEKGIDLGSYITKADAKVEILSAKSCYLTITEGKFHQIKKMFKALKNEVLFLKRVKMNKLELDVKLNYGEYRELTEDELKLLKD